MAAISVRVDEALQSRVEEAAQGDGRSVSEWVREVMVDRLGLGGAASWEAPTTLSKSARQQLALLHKLIALASTDADEVGYHSRMAHVVQEGFTAEYADAFIAINDEIPMRDCRLTWDILDMFRVLQASVDQLDTVETDALGDQARSALSFKGFDFNDPRERRLADYAAYLVQNGRWEEFAESFDRDHEHGNSHFPVLPTYERMLAVFQPLRTSLRGRYLLDVEELASISSARSPR